MFPEYKIHLFKPSEEYKNYGMRQKAFVATCASAVASASRMALESSPSVPLDLRNAYNRIVSKRIGKPGRLGRRKLSLTGDDELDGLLFSPVALGKRPRALSLQEIDEVDKV
jgi:hypothetical protein